MAKAGLNATTVGLAQKYGPAVRMKAIMPGPFLTDISKAWDMDEFESQTREYPMRRGAGARRSSRRALLRRRRVELHDRGRTHGRGGTSITRRTHSAR